MIKDSLACAVINNNILIHMNTNSLLTDKPA